MFYCITANLLPFFKILSTTLDAFPFEYICLFGECIGSVGV